MSGGEIKSPRYQQATNTAPVPLSCSCHACLVAQSCKKRLVQISGLFMFFTSIGQPSQPFNVTVMLESHHFRSCLVLVADRVRTHRNIAMMSLNVFQK